jgi:CheY-like chemotaxis protein
MIIIDQDTEDKLAAMLGRIKAQSINARCIYFNIHRELSDFSAIKEKIITSARKHIPSLDMQIYFCSDGDAFLLTPIMESKSAKELILDIVDYTGKAADDAWVSVVELPLNVNKLLLTVEAKIEKRRHIEELNRQRIAQQQAERKRQFILNGGGMGASKQEEIKNRRANRNRPELMIIEDDAFSRRLVENVLQKQYALTGLGEANYALETYARIAPDLLFLDINLPAVTGHELLERIITMDPDAYVIMLSGNCDRDNIAQAVSKGAKGFIAKPFTKDKLFQYIERCPHIALRQKSEAFT